MYNILKGVQCLKNVILTEVTKTKEKDCIWKSIAETKTVF